MLCDTNGGSMPEEIARIDASAAETVARRSASGVGIHCHNDCDLAVANSLAAVDAGAVQVQGTINGFGERCGNADLISVIANLALKKTGLPRCWAAAAWSDLTELSRYVYEIANMNFRNGQPFVGPSAFAHKGGMHVHAVARATSSYEHIDPEMVGNERRILVSELSGRSNIVALTTQHNIQHDRELMEKILARSSAWRTRATSSRRPKPRSTCWSRSVSATFSPISSGSSTTSKSARDARGEMLTEGDRQDCASATALRHEVAEGDGPVNALDAALRKAFNGSFPTLRDMRLVDYRVRVVNSEAGTAARIRVVIESADSARGLGHGRGEREHHRSQLDGPGGRLRVQTAQRRATAEVRTASTRRRRLDSSL